MESWQRSALLLGAGAAIGSGLCYALLRSQPLSSSQPVIAGTGTVHPKPVQQHATSTAHTASVQNFMEDDILREQLTRNVQFFGEEGQQRIADAFVIVVGLGVSGLENGVGSHAAHMLLRAGVGRLRLIDFDLVTLSSLNRHAVATRADVGLPKATVIKNHFLEIIPEADIEAVVEMYTAEKEDALLAGKPTFVFDAIDNIDTKVALIAACVKRGLKVLSSAGAGAKADPTRLHIVDISESSSDPLARAVRHKLRRQYGIDGGVPMLLSTEKPRCKLVASEEVAAAADPREYQIIPNFRVTTIPVLGTTPAVFGQAAAGWMLCQLAEQPFNTTPLFLMQDKQYDEQLRWLTEREMHRWGEACPPLPVDLDDIIYLMRELWRGRSAKAGEPPGKPGADRGLTRSTGYLCLTRWDKDQSATVDNLVLLTHDEADEHDAADLATIKATQPEYYARVQRILQKARNEHFY